MKINYLSTNKFITITFLIIHAYTWNMIQINTEYNNKRILTSLPKECFNLIIAHSINTAKSLKKILNPALNLCTICRACNTNDLLINMGKLCKVYSLEEKNKAMEMLLKNMNDFKYHNRRHAALLLTYAGAENNAYKYYPLLDFATQQSDEQMITTLFENGANPNQKSFDNEPACFNIKNVNIAKIFVKYGVDFNIQGYSLNPNILFASLCYNYSPELIEFYINNKVDITIKGYNNNSNLLHALAAKHLYKYNINNYIKIGLLLIKAAPELLNALNDDENTPLDIAQQQVGKNKYNIMIALITLFEKHGGKTAKQLK